MTLDFITSLATIVFIDLMLAGDNAIVIGMAARNMDRSLQRKAVLWGTAGAVLIRIAATVLVTSLFGVPWLMLAGGLLLLWIAYKLLVQEEQGHGGVKAGRSLWAAVRTIVIADAAMGLDNVIAVAGAAHGSLLLVILGLLISIPVVVWGSTLFIRLIGKYPWLLYFGSAVLAYTAVHMIMGESRIEPFFVQNPLLAWAFTLLVILAVLAAGLATQAARRSREASKETSS